MKKLKSLKDSAIFTLCKGKNSTVYTLNKLDRKVKKAVYTSNKSGKTFARDWTLEVYPVNKPNLQ